MKKSFYTASEMTPTRMGAIIGCLPHAFGYNVTCDKNKVIFEPAGPSKADVENKCKEIISKWERVLPAIRFIENTIVTTSPVKWKTITCYVIRNGRCEIGNAIFAEDVTEKNPSYSVAIGRLIALARALDKKLPDIVEKYLESI